MGRGNDQDVKFLGQNIDALHLMSKHLVYNAIFGAGHFI
jgi:hypothetical protein